MKLKNLIQTAEKKIEPLKCIIAFLTRLVVGFVFLQSGWGKLQHLDKVTEFFASLGIPAASIQAPFAASMEFFCGGLLILGLFTRLASIPLIVIMVVAIATAKRADIESIDSLFDMSEFLYILLLTWLAVFGAGKLSLEKFKDKLLKI